MKLRNILKAEESSQSVTQMTCWKFHIAQFRATERQSEHAWLPSLPKTISTCTDCRLYQRQSEHALTAVSTKENLNMHWLPSLPKTIWKCTDCRLYQRQCTCSLCPVCVCQFLALQTVIPHITRFSTMWLVALPQKTLKEMRFNYVTVIQAKSWWTLAHFQTIHFTICCKWWCNHQQHCINSQRDLLWNRQHWLEVKCTYREINQSLN